MARETPADLAPALYTRPEAFQRERRTLFQDTWLLLARAATIKAPGDYVAQSPGGWPVFVIADAGGALGGFRNVCRHQGLPLFDTGTGHCDQIRCRYHGWTYDSAGRFVLAPPKVAPPDPADPMHRLERIAAAQLAGFVFVHLGPSPPPAEMALAPLATLGLDTLEFRGEIVTDIDANWKLVMEEALAAPPALAGRSVLWPTLVVDASVGGAVVHQVIPRAFQRTRVHHYRYGTVDMADAHSLKAAAAAAQLALEQGTARSPSVTPALTEFRRRLQAVQAAPA